MTEIPTKGQMLKNKPKLEKLVKDLLIRYPQAKGDDMILLWRFYYHFSNIRISFGSFKALMNAPAAESITRARRKIQSLNPDLRPTERVQHKRRVNEEACREYYKTGIMPLSAFE